MTYLKGRLLSVAALTQIKWVFLRWRRVQATMEIRTRSMFNAGDLGDELLALKGEVSRLLNRTGEGPLDASKDRAKDRAEALADQIKAALNDLTKTLGEQEDQLENFIADRPVTSLASTFALGVIIGFMLRRH